MTVRFRAQIGGERDGIERGERGAARGFPTCQAEACGGEQHQGGGPQWTASPRSRRGNVRFRLAGRRIRLAAPGPPGIQL